MTKQTRYKISIYAGLFMALVVILCIFYDKQNMGITAITAIMTMLSSYIWGETKRPSDRKKL